MDAMERWRMARFRTEALREEFIEHARAVCSEAVEVEPLDDGLTLRFRAPARVELGLAEMVSAHQGILVPTPTFEPEPVRLAR